MCGKIPYLLRKSIKKELSFKELMHGFLAQLKREGKILLENQNKDLEQDYLKKAKSSLKAARVLREQKLYAEMTSMAYYAMYHATISLFAGLGIVCKNHAGAILLLTLFNINNIVLEQAKEQRIRQQYYTEEARDTGLIQEAENFLQVLE